MSGNGRLHAVPVNASAVNARLEHGVCAAGDFADSARTTAAATTLVVSTR